MNNKFRLGVLGSGKGSNFIAIADAVAAGQIPAEIAIVLSDVESAGILTGARERKLPAQFVPPGKFRTKLDEEAERGFVAALQAAKVDLVVLAGFMRVLKGDFLRAFEGRIVNIHPSLLPSFPGLEAWKQALDHGVKVTGCTVHFVDAGVDAGPIIGQQAVQVLDNDTPETLHQRIHKAEHRLYSSCVRMLALGQISVVGRKVLWKRKRAIAEIAIDPKRGWVLPGFGSARPDKFRYQAYVHFEKDETWGKGIGTWTLLVALSKKPDVNATSVEATVYFFTPEAPQYLLEEGAKFELLHGENHYTHGVIKRVIDDER